MTNYQLKVEPTETGFSAYSPDVPGVGVAAETRDEAIRLLHEAIAFHREDDNTEVGGFVVCSIQTHVQGTYSPQYSPSYSYNVSSVNTSGTVGLPSWNYGGSQKEEEALQKA